MTEQTVTYNDLVKQIAALQSELASANDTIEAIRTGQVDALIVHGANGHEIYTLKSADQTYRFFIEKMNEGAVTLNSDGIILYSNSQFAQLVGLPLSRIIGTPFEQFIALGHKNQYKLLMERGWKEDCKGEVVLKTKKYPVVQLSLTTLELDDGLSLSIIITDLTEQKEAQKDLKQKNDLLEKMNKALEVSNSDLLQFASVASHDLQEPLRKIEVFANIIDRVEAGKLSDEARMYFEKILLSSRRMKQLIIDVLNYSRLSATDNHLTQTDIGILVKECISDYELLINEKKASIHVGKLPVIEVNVGQMRQVFQNLLSNALKFSRKDKRPVISICAARVREKKINSAESDNGKYFRFSVKDNGIGFDEKYEANIFSLFERLHAKDKYEGTGIGLAITKKIIEKHNGVIVAKSKEGMGSEFIFVLPASH